MHHVQSDAELVQAVQSGHKEAFNFLVVRYHYKILKLAYRYVYDASDANDIAQEVFIKMYHALAHFKSESSFFTWLYRIAINTAKTYIMTRNASNKRLKKTAVSYYQSYSVGQSKKNQMILSDFSTPERLLLSDEMESVVLNAIEALPQELQQALLLREIEGLPYETIAQKTNSPIGTVRSRIFRARLFIESHIKPYLAQ